MGKGTTGPFGYNTDNYSKLDENDPFVIAKKRRYFLATFFDPILLPRVEKRLLEQANFKDSPELAKSLAPSVVRSLRGVVEAMTGDQVGTPDRETEAEMRYRYPHEINLLIKGIALKNQGKSDAEILEALQES